MVPGAGSTVTCKGRVVSFIGESTPSAAPGIGNNTESKND
jgi:hypothetical protein